MNPERARILRDCATRYRWQGRDIRPLEDAVLRVDRLDERVLGALRAFLGDDHPVDDAQWRALVALDATWDGVLARLRGPSSTEALSAAEGVLRAWLSARLDRKEKAPNPYFTGTVFLRCADPTRFPIVALPDDLIASTRERTWRTVDEFVGDYRRQVQVMRALARRYGFRSPALLDDGIHTFSRCQSAPPKSCPLSDTLGPCQGQHLADARRGATAGTGRRQVLQAFRKALAKDYADEHRARSVPELLSMLVPSEERLRDAFAALAPDDAERGVVNLVDGVEILLRVRAYGVAKKIVSERSSVPDRTPTKGTFPDHDRGGAGEQDTRPWHEIRRRRRKPAPGTDEDVDPKRTPPAPPKPKQPTIDEISEVMRTPRTTVERMAKLKEADAVKRAKKKRTWNRKRQPSA